MMAAGRGATGRQARAAGGDHRTALRVIALDTVAHMLRSRRFYARIVTVVIAVRALGQIGQENGAGMMERLAAWNKQQTERFERQAERQAQHLQRHAERQGRRLIRKAKGPLAWKP